MKYIKEFFTLPLEEQQAALSHVATQKGLPLIVVEKDLWVTILLHILFVFISEIPKVKIFPVNITRLHFRLR